MDDARSHLLGVSVDEEGTSSTFRALREFFGHQGSAGEPLYRSRSHYFSRRNASRRSIRALSHVSAVRSRRLGIEHIGCLFAGSARPSDLHVRNANKIWLIKELAKAGIDEIDAANTWIRDRLPASALRALPRPAALPEIASGSWSPTRTR